MVYLYSSISFILAASLVTAHGAHSDHELHHRNHYVSKRSSLKACRDNADASKLFTRSVNRRAALLQDIRKEKRFPQDSTFHLHERDLTSASAISHHSNLSVTADNYSTIFAGNKSCLLSPEVTDGPYYVSGEYIRKDIRESQAGVALYLDVQVIDVSTCQPVTNAYFDAWHANATGVYSGIVASGNGNSADSTNLNKTFLRGLQPTNSDGVVQFITIFPGHYDGRATHLHVLAHRDGSVHSNGTYSGGNITHVGQLFFDESLRTAVEKISPYSTNTQAVTLNSADQWAQLQANDDYDPFVEYAYLGSSVADGLLAWITIGIDTTAAYDDAYTGIAAYLTENGGVLNGNGNVGGGAGSGSGGPPSGSNSGVMPSGTPPGGFSSDGGGGQSTSIAASVIATSISSSTSATGAVTSSTRVASSTTRAASTTTTKKTTTSTKKATTTKKVSNTQKVTTTKTTTKRTTKKTTKKTSTKRKTTTKKTSMKRASTRRGRLI